MEVAACLMGPCGPGLPAAVFRFSGGGDKAGSMSLGEAGRHARRAGRGAGERLAEKG